MSPRSEGSFTPFKHEIEQKGCVRRQNLEVAARRSLFLSFARLHSKSRPTKSPEVQVAPSSRGRHAVHDPSLGPETGWKLSRSRLFPPQALVIRSDFKTYARFYLGFKTFLKPVFTYIARKTAPKQLAGAPLRYCCPSLKAKLLESGCEAPAYLKQTSWQSWRRPRVPWAICTPTVGRPRPSLYVKWP